MEKAKRNTLTPLERSNKAAMWAHFFNVLIIFLIAMSQSIVSESSGLYILILFILAFVPDILSIICWRKNHESSAIKHLVAIGFALLYTVVILTSSNPLLYIFCVPMILAYSLYNDMRGALIVSVGVVIVNVINIYLGATTGTLGYLGANYALAQILFIVMVSIYSIFIARTSNQNFTYLLSNLSSVTEEMKLGIADVHEELVRLNDASATTINAMQEVSTGTTDTAEAVQSQLLQTQEIQNKVNLVSESTTLISDHMHETLSILKEGHRNVSILVEKVDASVQSGVTVTEKLHILEQSVAEMNTIVEFISTIARETNLLSLNARIEASHAGQLGRGFAVVASEIAEMATQTKDATANITDLIDNISTVITEVVSAIQEMIDDIQDEKQSTDNTVDSFSAIQESTLSIRDNIELLSGHIRDLKDANSLIAESVQTISAVSEEVSAHAAETTSAEEENAATLARIDERMQTLLKTINK